MNSLHISLTEMRNERRVLKETNSILKHNITSKIYIASLHADDLEEKKIYKDNLILNRFKLSSKKFSKNLFVQIMKYLEFVYRITLFYRKKDIQMVNIHSVAFLPFGVLLKYFYNARLIYDTHELETETNGSNGIRKKLSKLIEKIKTRRHHIGIHPTFDAYNDSEQLKQEKNKLEKNLETNINFGREHYLKFEVLTTWQIWEDNGMQWSSMGYHDKEGFRCGVYYNYSMFNILTRKKLKLKERLLIVMEGNFVFLWHNSSFNTKEWKKYQYVYEKVIKS